MVTQVVKQSLWIALLASILDQIYHIARGFIHQLPDLLDSVIGTETAYYIGLKFLFAFLVSWFVLLNIRKSILILSVIIGVSGAAIFSVVLTNMFPGVYGFQMHFLHALSFGAATWLVLTYRIGGK